VKKEKPVLANELPKRVLPLSANYWCQAESSALSVTGTTPQKQLKPEHELSHMTAF
jgi:hypothetical protein